MPENRPDTHLTNTTIGRRGFLGGATLVSAAALLGTDVVPGHAAERTHSIAGTTLEQVGLPLSQREQVDHVADLDGLLDERGLVEVREVGAGPHGGEAAEPGDVGAQAEPAEALEDG